MTFSGLDRASIAASVDPNAQPGGWSLSLEKGEDGMRPEELFWKLAAELQEEDPRVVEGTIMNGRCLRVGEEFLALVDYKGSGLVVKLPRARVTELIEQGRAQPFAPAGRVFSEWLSVPELDRRRWRALLREGVAHVAK
jgi:hypothetical protein